MAGSGRDVMGVICVKDAGGEVLVEGGRVREECGECIGKLLSEENTSGGSAACGDVEGPVN